MSKAGRPYRLSAHAMCDLADLYDYIATLSADRAERWLEQVWSSFDLLAAMPGIGHQRRDLPTGVRVWSIGNTVILYRPSKAGVHIIRVVDGRRDFKRLRLPR